MAPRLRNLESKVPAERWREFGPMARAVYQASSPALARLARDEFVKTWARELPSATACFEDDFEACIAHLWLPVGHRRVIRTTNLPERMFGEERRRTKVIPHAFGEKAVMKLMYAALMRARQGWRNVIVTAFEVKRSKRCAIIYAASSTSGIRRQTKARPAREFTARLGLDLSEAPTRRLSSLDVLQNHSSSSGAMRRSSVAALRRENPAAPEQSEGPPCR